MRVFVWVLLAGCAKGESDTEVDLSRWMFTTSETYRGQLGGIDGANQKCEDAASAAGLSRGNAFMAWLSTTDDAALRRVMFGVGPWRRPDGTVVFADRDALAGNPEVTLDLDETGAANPNGCVWTGTKAGGTSDERNCQNWDTVDVNFKGATGVPSNVSRAWTEFGPETCDTACRLYCLEQ